MYVLLILGTDIGYFINRNDHMLQGYVLIVDDMADVVAPAVDAMVI